MDQLEESAERRGCTSGCLRGLGFLMLALLALIFALGVWVFQVLRS